MTITQSVIKRFVKGFISGGVASTVLMLQSGVVITSFDDLKKLGGALAIAFITGALLSIEKALSWES